VFLRPVKSRILFEQMLGRGTRKGKNYPDKSHFTVFDCFNGTLLEYFRQATAITAELPRPEHRTLPEIIGDIWNNRDRDYNIRRLVKRLHRIDKEMSGEARELFAAYVAEGDLARHAKMLPGEFRKDFTGTMKLLRDPNFQNLLMNYPRPTRVFVKAYEAQDEVSSTWLIRGTDGREYKPEDYLSAFTSFVQENPAKVEAIGILLDRPRDWNTDALAELAQKLAAAPQHFTIDNLQKVHNLHYKKALVDIISMVKHAADEENPLQDAQRHGQVEPGAFFLDVGRCQVDGDVLVGGKIEAAVLDGRLDALAALLDGGIGQAHRGEGADPALGQIDFDLDDVGIDAEQSGALGLEEHGMSTRFACA
jgi:type I restriction enzyme R subunit